MENAPPTSRGQEAGTFQKSAPYYDAVYAGDRDYERAAGQLHALIQQHRRTTISRVLDVACGTGGFIPHLRQHYTVEGLDHSPEMLDIARQRSPDTIFHEADLVEFDLDQSYDALVCLGSSIGYAKTVLRLEQALRTMRRHVVPGGVVVVEPWFWPDTFRPHPLGATFVDQPDLKLARMSVARIEGAVSLLDFWFLIGTPGRVETFTERHELGLFTDEEYRAAFLSAGLQVTYDPTGLVGLGGRGLYIGVRR